MSKEERVLGVMRQVLIDVIRDTTTQPGMKHPLSESTIEKIRHALLLITTREGELAEAAGRPRADRPRFVDEPQESVVVPLRKPEKKKNDSPDD